MASDDGVLNESLLLFLRACALVLCGDDVMHGDELAHGHVSLGCDDDANDVNAYACVKNEDANLVSEIIGGLPLIYSIMIRYLFLLLSN